MATRKTGFFECTILGSDGSNDIAKDKLDEWIYFLKNEEIKPGFTARGLKEAEEKLNIMKLSDEERRAYERFIEDLRYQKSMYNSSYGGGFMEGRQKGLVEGMERGKAEGLVEGVERGKAEGLVEGKAEGLVEGKALVIEQLLTHRFGPLPDAIIARIRQAGMAELDDWAIKCLTVASLAELFDV